MYDNIAFVVTRISKSKRLKPNDEKDRNECLSGVKRWILLGTVFCGIALTCSPKIRFLTPQLSYVKPFPSKKENERIRRQKASQVNND